MRFAILAMLALMMGCKDEEEPVYELSREELMDPENCIECHPTHVEEWKGSMHAYASEDPLFIAMNARGQRETNGELGDFCVQFDSAGAR